MGISRIAALGAVLLIFACAGPQPIRIIEPVQTVQTTQPVQPDKPVQEQMRVKFDYAVHKPYLQKGNNTIKGQGFLRQQGGGIVTCAGNDVLLLPATSFFREMVNLARAGKEPLFTGKIDPAYREMLKHTQADAQGNFTVSGLPDGNWFLFTQVEWTVGYQPQGGVLMEEVRVANGETKQVLLTNKNFIGR